MDTFDINKIPIVDTHAHLFYSNQIDYPWMKLKDFQSLKRPLTEDDYRKDQASLPIIAMLFMETNIPEIEEETKLILKLSNEKDSIITGIISGILMKKDFSYVASYLEKIQHKKLLGIRYLVKNISDPTDTFFLQNDFKEKLKLLKKYKLPFMIGCLPFQLPDVIKLIEANPDIQFHLDHLGNAMDNHPFVDIPGNFEAWKDNVKTLSTFSNLVMKISPGYNFPRNHLHESEPYIEFVIQTFKNERIMVGSDYGHGSGNVSFVEWMDLVKKVLIKMKAKKEEVENIFYKNAEREYSLSLNNSKF